MKTIKHYWRLYMKTIVNYRTDDVFNISNIVQK